MTTTTKQIHTTGKKQTPEDDVRTRLRAHIMAGGTPKEFALGEGKHSTMANKLLVGMGLKKVFITHEEHAILVAMRKERGA
jgi:hypothetical protein